MEHILIIDDDPEMSSVIGQTMQKCGYEVSLAGNGAEAFQMQCAKPAGLVITDLLMPEKDGLETIVDFRRDFPKVPIITISGRSSTGFFLYMATRLGAVRTIEKP